MTCLPTQLCFVEYYMLIIYVYVGEGVFGELALWTFENFGAFFYDVNYRLCSG